jgi:hypothetical protein
MNSTGVLSHAFAQLNEALRDYLDTVAIDNVHGLLGRVVAVMDAEPP